MYLNELVKRLNEGGDKLYTTIHYINGARYSSIKIKAGSFEEAEWMLDKMKKSKYWQSIVDDIEKWHIDGYLVKVIPL